ncbi:MAG TPA: hypothetical protein VHD90_00280 [Phototrophicaceae bacterium]|nr:hypothetical protein [Phototrophicaceae bacterium]
MDDAKQVHIQWRRRLFGFHALIWLIARLAVGSLRVTPPLAIYQGFETWGVLVVLHGILLAILDGRDQARLPFAWLRHLIEPRERRWSLLTIDAALVFSLTIAILTRIIPFETLERFAAPISLLWLALVGFGYAQILLMIYAEVRDRSVRKRKRGEKRKPEGAFSDLVTPADDGELLDFPQPKPKIQRD